MLGGVRGDRTQPRQDTARTLWAATPTLDAVDRARPVRAARRHARGTSRRRGRRTAAGPRPAARSPPSQPLRWYAAGSITTGSRAGDRRLGHRASHLVGIRVRRAVGLMMDIVELADGAVAAACISAYVWPASACIASGSSPGEPEHLRPPRPEVVATIRREPLRPATQPALERVRVGVDHRRDERHSSILAATRTAASASSSSTCSAGAWLIPVRLRTSTIAAGTRSPITPASCPAKQTTSGGAVPSTSAPARPSRSRSSTENECPIERDATATWDASASLDLMRELVESCVLDRTHVDPQPHARGDRRRGVRLDD